ncbi:MAG: bifunctional hydroxymethylpyrimidine kinase/phosphomethylpyrimidine kinase [Pyrinomonadaceae bacterium]
MNGNSTAAKPPVCLTVAGLDPSGGAGIIADIKTFSAFGCFPTAAVASVTFQNTQAVFGAVSQTAESVRRQVEPIIDDYEIAALKTGMLPTKEIIDEVGRLVTEFELPNFVVDPVVRSTSGFDLVDDAALTSVIERLFPLATVVTPNIPEAERITGTTISTEADIEAAAAKMRAFGAANVLIKGGHLLGTTARDLLFIGETKHVFVADFIETASTHGTGCTLAAAITANLALGKSLTDAIAIAKTFVHEAIRTSPGLGRGNSPINVQ